MQQVKAVRHKCNNCGCTHAIEACPSCGCKDYREYEVVIGHMVSISELTKDRRNDVIERHYLQKTDKGKWVRFEHGKPKEA